MKAFLQILSCSTLFFVALHSQESNAPGVYSGKIQIIPALTDTVVFLSHHFIFKKSVILTNDSVALIEGKHFNLSDDNASIIFYRKNILEIQREQFDIFIQYKYLPLTLQLKYSNKILETKPYVNDSRKKNILTSTSTYSNLFGSEIQKSGNISRGFTIGSHRDFTLSSGFRLQFSGKLSQDIDIVAALTDENTPIQPQGNTQTLQEFDNVFVEMKSKNYNATLGDFYYTIHDGEFAKANRKLQGAKLSGSFQNEDLHSSLIIVGAANRGKFSTNQFTGIDGVQGPYRLLGKNNERNIIVIAGTEKVFINGEVMTRGEQNDYSIDYGSGEIIFSSRRLITNASRITVDFEYTDRQYTRNYFSAASRNTISDALSFNVIFFREGDNQDAPIDIELSESDKFALAKSGNTLASKSGVVFVGRDSITNIGKGDYIKVDTLIAGIVDSVYRFEPGISNALYNVSFSFVGNGKGDYSRSGIGRYLFAGKKNGQYLPIIILPAPQLHQIANVSSQYAISKQFIINAEFAGSSFDANRFSTIGDNNNAGNAMKLSMKYSSEDVKIGNTSLGALDVSFSERFLDERFVPTERINEIEFTRKWNIDSTVSTQALSEETREAAITMKPNSNVTIGGTIGSMKRGREFNSLREEITLQTKSDIFPTIDYRIENISSDDMLGRLKSSWLRQKGNTQYTIANLIPGFRFESEQKEVKNKDTDSLYGSSFSLYEVAPKIAVKQLYGITASSEFSWRKENVYSNGNVIPQSLAFTQTYEAGYKYGQKFSTSSSVILRKKEYEKIFQTNFSNQQTILVRSQSRYTPLAGGIDADVFYEVSTERTSRLERVFYKVRKGEGQYVWVDGNGNGKIDLNDERDFQLSRYDGDYTMLSLQGDVLYPIIDLKTSSRLRVTPYKFFVQPSSWIEKAFTKISTETFVRIEEKSSDPQTQNIYLLKFSHFLNRVTTLQGSQIIQHDIHVFENSADVSLRFRFLQRKGLGQYNSGLEENYYRERGMRIRFQLDEQMSDQIDVTNKQDNASASVALSRSRQIVSDGVANDFSYRPEQNIEIGFKLENSQADDYLFASPVTSNLNSQSIRTIFSFQGSGQARIEIAREEIIVANKSANYIIPFELTGGRDEGKTFLMTSSLDYRIGSNVQVTFQYNGRVQQNKNTVHTGRMEIKAYF